MSLPDPPLLDLRRQPRPELLTAFVELYRNTFTDPAEREDPAQWPARLFGEPAPPQPRMHLLVALDDPSAAAPVLFGGLAFEYYRDSRCGLLTYLVVAPARRRRGLARRLVARAIALLHDEARAHGGALGAVFAEAEDPAQVAAAGHAMPPQERLRALARLGARRVVLPYVQPRLAGGSAACRHLLLLAFYPSAAQLDGGMLRRFLHEFYRALGVEQPQHDADFRLMDGSLDAPVALAALQQ